MRSAPTFMMRFAPLVVLATPLLAHAQTVSRIVGLFNIFVGLMLTAAILTYGLGFIIWSVRLGTWPSYRTEAIKVMEWAVAILFVLVVLLAIVQFFQYHPHAAAYVISFIVVVIVFGIIIYLAATSGGGDKEEEH